MVNVCPSPCGIRPLYEPGLNRFLMEKFVNFSASFPIRPVCPHPNETSTWSFALDSRLKRMSTVPFSAFGSGRMSMFSGSKCPVWAISRADRIMFSLLYSCPGLTRSSRRITFSYRRSLPFITTLFIVACGPSITRSSRSMESPCMFFSMGTRCENR